MADDLGFFSFPAVGSSLAQEETKPLDQYCPVELPAMVGNGLYLCCPTWGH